MTYTIPSPHTSILSYPSANQYVHVQPLHAPKHGCAYDLSTPFCYWPPLTLETCSRDLKMHTKPNILNRATSSPFFGYVTIKHPSPPVSLDHPFLNSNSTAVLAARRVYMVNRLCLHFSLTVHSSFRPQLAVICLHIRHFKRLPSSSFTVLAHIYDSNYGSKILDIQRSPDLEPLYNVKLVNSTH